MQKTKREEQSAKQIMNCREFQNEFEERAGLNDAANLHLKNCADCEKLHREQSHIWQMIESLPEVAAPADFNHKFRARLATAKASDFRPAWRQSLRYVVPVFAAVLVLTMVFASQNFFVSTPPTEELVIVQNDEKPPVLLNNDAQAETINANIITANYNASTSEFNSTTKIEKTRALPDAAVGQNPNKKEIAPKKDAGITGGVKDFGVKPPSTSIVPPEFSPVENKTTTNPNGIGNSNGQSVESLLSFLGIETVSENGKLRVTSVKSNSIPERAGLKTGDFIETIDGKSVSGSDRITAVPTMTVLRGNERITIINRAQ